MHVVKSFKVVVIPVLYVENTRTGNHRIIGLVSMNVSETFDTLPHGLIGSKLRQYGADERTLSLIEDYLSIRPQRVKRGDRNSTWQEVGGGVPQGSILGPVFFNMFMNDLVYVIKNNNSPTFADDTQIFAAETKSRQTAGDD